MTKIEQFPSISQETLAEIIGVTRSRVSVFMNRRVAHISILSKKTASAGEDSKQLRGSCLEAARPATACYGRK
jgi:predicted XRE-type DNA-binding protein